MSLQGLNYEFKGTKLRGLLEKLKKVWIFNRLFVSLQPKLKRYTNKKTK